MAAIAPSTTANGRQYRRVSSSFARPADTTAYAIGDLIANSTTAASVTPLSWTTTGSRPFDLPGIRLHKTGTSSATIRCYLFTSSPTVATTGDNGVFATVTSGSATCFAIYEGTVYAFADGAVGLLVPISGIVKKEYVGDPATVYGLLEARSVFTPGNAETITVTPILEFDQ